MILGAKMKATVSDETSLLFDADTKSAATPGEGELLIISSPPLTILLFSPVRLTTSATVPIAANSKRGFASSPMSTVASL